MNKSNKRIKYDVKMIRLNCCKDEKYEKHLAGIFAIAKLILLFVNSSTMQTNVVEKLNKI